MPGPLEPVYDYKAIHVTRDEIERRPNNLWRYRELLPITGEPLTGFNSGFTPLVRCDRLAKRLGLSELYIKDDSVNHPTLSYKDRVVSIAATRAVELGFKVLACASTGNLANSVAAHAARLGMECCVFIPDNLEAGKVFRLGDLSSDHPCGRGQLRRRESPLHAVADRYGWGFVNINLRSYYAEGAKTCGFEIVEQLGGAIRDTSYRQWPGARCCRGSCADSGSFARLAWLMVSCRGFTRPGRRLRAGRARAGERTRVPGARTAGHNRQVDCDWQPGGRLSGAQSVRSTGGSGAAVSDDQIIDAIQLLAETEGIFTEPAGGTTLAGAIELIRRGAIGADESVVICVTATDTKPRRC